MSNKMLKGNAKKIKLAPKLTLISLSLILVLLGIAVALRGSKINDHTGYCLKTDDKCGYKLDVARSEQELQKGLSGRPNLPQDEGMLFEFANTSQECIWMKDMNFNLDIIWLNERKEIVQTKENVSPETYPSIFCADDTKYVIELNAGQVKRSGFITGQRLDF